MPTSNEKLWANEKQKKMLERGRRKRADKYGTDEGEYSKNLPSKQWSEGARLAKIVFSNLNIQRR